MTDLRAAKTSSQLGEPRSEPLTRAAPRAAWLLYTLIVLEILFMVSPAAGYYYAVYAVPLNALADSPSTAWLTLHILPHFSASDSTLVNGLIAISWPLIGAGLVLFMVGFLQIYTARFRQARGAPAEATATGLYRHIRHPQYLALALLGLGTALFWSRFLVWIAFVAMLCLYSALARLEESHCLRRFGTSYRRHMDRTGRFLPKRMERALHALIPGRKPGERSRMMRAVAKIAGITLALSVCVAAGAWLRHHAIGSLQIVARGPHTLLFLAPLGHEQRQRAADLLAPQLGENARLVYLAPPGWGVPELGLEAAADATPGNLDELSHPTSHGNRSGFEHGAVRVLVTEPRLIRPAAAGAALLAATVRIEPLAEMRLDLDATTVATPIPAGPGRWDGLPVPVY